MLKTLLENISTILTIITYAASAFFILIKPMRTRYKMKKNIISGTALINSGITATGRSVLSQVIDYPFVLFTGVPRSVAQINLAESYHHGDQKPYDDVKMAKELYQSLEHKIKSKGILPNSKYNRNYGILCSNMVDVLQKLYRYENESDLLESALIYGETSLKCPISEKVAAVTLSNLSIICRILYEMGNEQEYGDKAIRCAKASLEYYESQSNIEQTARLENNIGNIYSTMLQHCKDDTKKLEYYQYSSNFFEKSLSTYVYSKYPYEHARSHMNFGALNNLMALSPLNNRASYILRAKEAFEKAIYAFKENNNANEVAASYSNLALTICLEATTNSSPEKFIGAIKCIQNSLDFYTPQVNATENCRLHFRLGGIFDNLASLAGNADTYIGNLKSALSEYEFVCPLEQCRREYILAQARISCIFNDLYLTPELDKVRKNYYKGKYQNARKTFKIIMQTYPDAAEILREIAIPITDDVKIIGEI